MAKKYNAELVELIYTNNENEQFTQPISDLTEAGTMIDPNTSEECVLDTVRITNTMYAPHDVAIVYLDMNGNEHVQNVGDAVIGGTLLDPVTDEEMIINQVII